MTQIKEALIEANPWWKNKFIVQFKEREVYKNLQKYIPLPQIIALTGLRRVGKTSIMMKIVEDSMRRGINPKSIAYFSFDEFKTTDIRSILQSYEELMETNLDAGSYIFLLDEVQKQENWQDQLKVLYDRYKGAIKFIISGSESLFIKSESRKVLAGRLFEFQVEPLHFFEYLNFIGEKSSPIQLYNKELQKHFVDFLLTEGFPELVGIKDKEIIKKYISESIVEKIIYSDIPKLFSIKDITVLEKLLRIIIADPGQIIDLEKLGKELGITRQTTALYLSFLEKSFLIKKLYNFSRNKRKSERKLKRYYPVVILPDLLFKEDSLSQSTVFEWIMVQQLHAEFFWRDPFKNEVDIVLVQKNILPIEVKYGKVEFDSMLAFLRIFSLPKGIIITWNSEEKKIIDGKTIELIPGWKYLLSL